MHAAAAARVQTCVVGAAAPVGLAMGRPGRAAGCAAASQAGTVGPASACLEGADAEVAPATAGRAADQAL